jgi:hypothetical protein
VIRRKALKPKPEPSDAELLRRAEVSAKRAAARLERERRAEAAELSFRSQTRTVKGQRS